MSKKKSIYLLMEYENQNYSYDEFIETQFSSKITQIKYSRYKVNSVISGLIFGKPIHEASLIANSNFEVFKEQIEYDNFNKLKILELQEKLSKIKNNLKINKNKIIKNLKSQKNNKFINFIIKFFSIGKINKNKNIDKKISNIQTKWTEIKRIKKETNSNLKKLLENISKNQEINNKAILNIKQKNLKLQTDIEQLKQSEQSFKAIISENKVSKQKILKLQTDIEQLKQSEQSFKAIISENKVSKVNMKKRIDKLNQKNQLLKKELIEKEKTLIAEIDEEKIVADYETEIIKLNNEIINLKNNLKGLKIELENKQAFINKLEQKVKWNEMKINELQENLGENKQLIISLHEENDAYKKIQNKHNEKYVFLQSIVQKRDKKISFLREKNVLLEEKNLRYSGIESASEIFDSDIDSFNKDKINAQKQEQQVHTKLTKSQITL